MAMKTKQMPSADTLPDEEPAQNNEPYGSQVLRAMHKHAGDLMKLYDEMHGPLEHEEVKEYLGNHLAALEKHMSAIEKLHGKHYKDLEPLAGLMDEKDLTEDEAEEVTEDAGEVAEDAEDLSEEVEEEIADTEEEDKDLDTMDDAGVPAESDGTLEEPTPEEAIEGMEKPNKSLRWEEEQEAEGRSAKSGKKAFSEIVVVQDRRDGKWYYMPQGYDESFERWSNGYNSREEARAAAEKERRSNPDAWEKSITTGKAMPEELVDEDRGGLKDHEKPQVGEAAGFLGELSQEQNFGDEHRLKAYHYHKTLEGIGALEEAREEEAMKHWHSKVGHKRIKAQPSEDIDPKKARQILRDGEVHGKPLTEKQRGLFGAAAGRGEKGIRENFHIDQQGDKWRVWWKIPPGLRGFYPGQDTLEETFVSRGEAERYIESQIRKLEEKAMPGTPEWEAEEMTEPEHKGLHPHRKACKDASEFLGRMAREKAFGDNHRAEAAEHAKQLGDIGNEEEAVEEAVVEPGEMGQKDDEDLDNKEEKSLRLVITNQHKMISNLADKIKKVGALVG